MNDEMAVSFASPRPRIGFLGSPGEFAGWKSNLLIHCGPSNPEDITNMLSEAAIHCERALHSHQMAATLDRFRLWTSGYRAAIPSSNSMLLDLGLLVCDRR
jgi:hypothetical protein